MTISPGRLGRSIVPLAAVNLAALACFLLSFSSHGIGFAPYHIDLDVYRIGSRTWLDGRDLYGKLPPTRAGIGLPFSYPPIAAVLLTPLALLPMTAAGNLLSLITAGLTALVLRVFLTAVRPARASWRTVGWLLPAALLLEPVRDTIFYGQVNVLLMALVAADCLIPCARWPRGALVGVAAAVKLTPAAFILFFLIRRDYRAACTAVAAAGVMTAAGFLLDARDSARYWTSIVFQTRRPGNPGYAGNQSIQAVVTRAGLDPHTGAGLAVWLAAAAAVLVLACFGMRHAVNRGHDVWAVSLNAFAALLISPVSWSHHWVWGETAMLVLACLSMDDPRPAWRRSGLAIATAGTAIFAAAPQWWLPSGGDRELHWAVWEQIAGSSYVILAVIILAASATSQAGRRPRWTVAGHPLAPERYAIYLGTDLLLAGPEDVHGYWLRNAGERR